MAYKFLKKILFLLPPECAHQFVICCLKFSKCFGLFYFYKTTIQNPIKLNNINFKNPIGIAAGFDKSGTTIAACESLGIGFIEVGTFTPKAQKGNPKPRIFRIPKLNALINRMGLNNVGIERAIKNIKSQKYSIPVGISIGKNNDTTDDNALNDYLFCMEKSYETADYLTINISCPNVPNHNSFWSGDNFTALLKSIKEKQIALEKKHHKYIPIYIKISPDLEDNDLMHFCQIMNASGLDGVIATNTTQWRPNNIDDPALKERGGLSGPPIYNKMLYIIKQLKKNLNSNITIIALGGIDSPTKAQECLNAGADLIQIYTGLIYEGPALINKILKALSK